MGATEVRGPQKEAGGVLRPSNPGQNPQFLQTSVYSVVKQAHLPAALVRVDRNHTWGELGGFSEDES